MKLPTVRLQPWVSAQQEKVWKLWEEQFQYFIKNQTQNKLAEQFTALWSLWKWRAYWDENFTKQKKLDFWTWWKHAVLLKYSCTNIIWILWITLFSSILLPECNRVNTFEYSGYLCGAGRRLRWRERWHFSNLDPREMNELEPEHQPGEHLCPWWMLVVHFHRPDQSKSPFKSSKISFESKN